MTIDSLTPIEYRDGLFFKRDDLFSPFPDKRIGGGKLRQCLALLTASRAPGVVSGSSLSSPQAAIVAAAADLLSRKCILVVGGRRRTGTIEFAREHGAEFRFSPTGRHTVLFSHARRIQAETGYTLVPYGMYDAQLHGPAIDATATQVENLPDDLDEIVVTCGSGNSAAGILHGLTRFNKKVKRITLIGTGPSRQRFIDRHVAHLSAQVGKASITWETIQYHSLPGSDKFRYDSPRPFSFSGIVFHPLYEAKAFRWALTNAFHKKKVLFWLVAGELLLGSSRCKP